jgi:cell division protein FtsN
MVVDYSGRRPVPKNRPRKQPVGIFIFILISAVSMAFALGVMTGWFIHRPALKASKSQQALDAGEKGAPAAPQQTGQQNPETGARRGGDPPLTFYETLPKGGKAMIGSGLNPKNSEEFRMAKPATVQPPPPQKAAVPPAANSPAAIKAEERKEQGKGPAEQAKKAAAGAKQADQAGKFCVQVASSKERGEAEALKARLAEKGLPVYVIESAIKNRGTWYRVRIGKHLSQQAAGELAAKAGKGAMVIPE